MFAVELKNIVHALGDQFVLNGLDLGVYSGEFLVVLGLSKSGKTTLLRVLNGAIQATAGEIVYSSDGGSHDSPNKAALVSLRGGNRPLKTVFQNVSVGLGLKHVNKPELGEELASIISSFRIPEIARQQASVVTLCQQLQSSLARVLCDKPVCLLFDDPFAHVETRFRHALTSELKRVCKMLGVTTVFATRENDIAILIGERIAILSNGRIQQIDAPEALYKRPCNRFVAETMGESNFISGTIQMSEGGYTVLETDLCPLVGVIPRGNRALAAGDAAVAAIRPGAIKLDLMPVEENAFRGVIKSSAFFGEYAQYKFVSNGICLKINELNPRFLGQSLNQKLYAWVDPDDVVILDQN